MNLTLLREIFDENCTEGSLYVNGQFECYTLEPCYRSGDIFQVKVQNKTAIPYGDYQVTIDFSPHFGKDLPHILNVPNFDGVRIHPGNTAADTEGCVLLGEARGKDNITQSVLAFNAFFPKLQKAVDAHEPITLSVVDKLPPIAV